MDQDPRPDDRADDRADDLTDDEDAEDIDHRARRAGEMNRKMKTVKNVIRRDELRVANLAAKLAAARRALEEHRAEYRALRAERDRAAR